MNSLSDLTYPCQKCGGTQKFATIQLLQKHIETQHSLPYFKKSNTNFTRKLQEPVKKLDF